MLEQTSLHLLPWTASPAGDRDGRVRALMDAQRVQVGFVCQEPAQGPRWFRWLNGKSLLVHETLDSSLVFSLRRGWGWPARWHVVDADGRLVGTLRGRAMLDGFGHFLALIEQQDAAGRGRFLAMDGRVLGSFAVEKDGTRVTFVPEMEGNPFAKMMLLGAVLVREV